MSASAIYSALRQAGASPEEAMTLTAISGAESGWSTTAYNPGTAGRPERSVGAFQVNLDAHQGAKIPGTGYTVTRETMARADLAARYALSLYRSQGPSPWSVTGLRSGTKFVLNDSHFGQAAAAASAYGDQALPASQIMAFATAGQRTSTGTDITPLEGSAMAGATGDDNVLDPTWKVDRSGMLFRTPEGQYVLRYQPWPGVFVEWSTTDEAGLRRSGYDPGRAMAYGGVPEGQLLVDHTKTSGISALVGMWDAGYDSVRDWYEEVLYSNFGQNDEAARDPGIQAVIATIIGRSAEIDPLVVENMVRQTDYWRKTTEAANTWRDLSPAEQEARVHNVAAEIAYDHRRIVGPMNGREISANDQAIMGYARLVASGQMTRQQVLGMFEDAAIKVESTPFAQKARDAGIESRRFDMEIENMASQLDNTARQWGVQLSQDSLMDWSKQVMMNFSSVADFEDAMEQQASVLYPTRPAGMKTTEYAQPWLNTVNRVLETNVDLFDDRVQQALQSGVTVFDFQRELMQSEDWLYTENAMDKLTNSLGRVAQQMGFA